MTLRFLTIILVSFTAFSCSSYKSEKPTFDEKYKSGATSVDAEGKAKSKDESASEEVSTPNNSSTTSPYSGQDTQASTESPSYNLKDAQTYVSDKIDCDDGDLKLDDSGPNPSLNVVGGMQASDDDLVSASTFRLVLNKSHYCTATLVGRNHLLTAAHCFEGVQSSDQIEIGFGPDGRAVERIRVKDFKVHPLYRGMASISNPSPESQLYDIALISFEGELSERMLPSRIATPSFVYAGMHVVIAGYGAISTSDKARRPLAWLITELSSLSNKYNELQIKQKPGIGACYGDSGGPTYIVASGNRCLQVVGTISGPSRGTSSCEGGGGLLMDVTRQRVWIACNFKKMGYPLRYINTTGFDCSRQ